MSDHLTEREAHGTARFAARFPVALQLEGLPAPLAAHTRDIGTGGVCVETPSPFALSSMAHVVLDLPTGRISSHAKGCWQRVGADTLLTGIRFVSMDATDVHALWDMVLDGAKETARFLHDVSALETPTLDDAMELALRVRLRHVPGGHYICNSSMRCADDDAVFVVREGSLVYELHSHHDCTIRLDQIAGGAVFGGPTILGGMSPEESIFAETDTELLELPGYTFRYLERSKPFLARCVADAVMQRRALHVSELIERIAASR